MENQTHPIIDICMKIVQTPEAHDPELVKRMQDVWQLEESRYYYSIVDGSVPAMFGLPYEDLILVKDHESDLNIQVSSLEEADEIMESLEECNG